MRINVAIPEQHVDAPVLDAALESVTRLNEKMLGEGSVPTFEKGLKYGVKWRPEPPGQEHFDHAHKVLQRRWGDCDDLAPWHAASLRHTGEDPDATAVAKRSGPSRWHAVVLRGDGSIDDPSKRAGMGQPQGVIGAALPLMWPLPPEGVHGAYLLRPQIAMRPFRGAIQARADLPWYWREHTTDDKPSASDFAMTALHTAPLASTALTGAIDGLVELAGAAGFALDGDLERLCCVSDAVHGLANRDQHLWERLCDAYHPAHVRAAQHIVGSFFSKLAHAASSVVSPLSSVVKTVAPMAASFIPGGSAALKAVELAQKAFPGAAAVAPSPGGGGGSGPGGMRGFTCTFH